MNNTINDIYKEYINYLKISHKITTLKLIEYKFKNYILPYFGQFTIKEIKKSDYINFIINLNSLNFSDSFFQQVEIMCKKFFYYISINYNIKDITKNISIKKNDLAYKSNQKKGIWTIKEFKKFIKKVNDPIYHALFTTLYYTGIRKGEALALKISDFQNDYIIVNKSITKELYNGNRIITKPKSKNSVRNIKIDLLLKFELKKLIKYYQKNYNNFNNDFFLFGANKPISCTTLERKKTNYCKLSNVKNIRIHDFRHSHATMLYQKNIKVKAIQQRLGHSSISITLNTYVHMDEKEEKKLIKMINFIRL